MTAIPRPLPPDLHQEMNRLAKDFILGIADVAAKAYGPEVVASLAQEGLLMLIYNFAMQAMVAPEACGLAQLDLDAVAKGAGIGLGTRCAHLDQQQSTQFFGLLAQGYHAGQIDALTGAAKMETKGRA